MRLRLVLLLVVLPHILFALQNSNNQFQIFEQNNKQGLRLQSGKIVIPAKYDKLGWSNAETAPVGQLIGYMQNNQWGLISVSNEKITLPEYAFVNALENKTILAAKAGRLSQSYFHGAFNAKGEVIIPFRYSSISSYSNNYIVSESKGGNIAFGLVDVNYNIILPLVYENITIVSDQLLGLHVGNGQVQLYNTIKSRVVVDSVTSVESWRNEYFKIYKGLEAGLINSDGEIVAPIDYKDFEIENGILKGLKFPSWKVFTADNVLLRVLIGDDLIFFEDKIMLTSDKAQQILNYRFESLIPHGFNSILDIKGNNVLFKTEDRYGLYSMESNKKVMHGFDSLRLEGEFVYSIKKEKNNFSWTLFDVYGVKRTKFDYQQIRSYHDHLFAIKRRDHWGFMDRTGKEVIHCVYDFVEEFNDDMSVVGFHGEQGIINSKSHWVVLPRKADLQYLKNDLFLSRANGKTTLENINGELIYFTDNRIEFKDSILFEYRSDSNIVHLNLMGTLVKPQDKFNQIPKIEETKFINEDWIAVKMNGGYGFVDAITNILKISNRYQDVGSAKGELISVKILGKWGAIDKKENIIVQPNYDEELQFVNNISVIIYKGMWGLITNEGNEIVVPKNEMLLRNEFGNYKIRLDSKYGLADANGKILINTKYDSLEDLGNGFVIIQKGEKFGVTTINGVNTIPQIYNKIIYNSQLDAYFASTNQQWELIINEQ